MNGAGQDERKFYFLLLAWGLFLVLFLWSLGGVLSPIILFFVLAYLLSSFYGTRIYGRLVLTLASLTVLWLIWTAGFILTPFVLALVLAYILSPLVRRAEREGLGRTGATLVILATLLLVVVMAVLLLGPLLSAQVANFVSKLPEFLTAAVAWAQRMLDKVSNIPLPGLRRTDLGEVLNIDTTNLAEYLQSQQEAIRRGLLTGVLGLGKGVGVALTIVSYLLITPILTFFLLRDFDRFVTTAGRLVPRQRRPTTFAFFRRYDELLGKFLRSQLVVAIMVGVIIGVGFWIAGFPYALLLGVIAGVFNVIPYLGFALSLIPAVLIALVSGDIVSDFLKIAAVYAVEQVLENFLSPRIVGESVGLHPVWVIFAIVVFSFFFGFIGLLIAVPAAVGIKLMLSNLVSKYEASTYYRGPDGESASGPGGKPAYAGAAPAPPLERGGDA